MIELRSVSVNDSALLAGWFGDVAFVRWWGGIPLDAATVAKKYLGGRPDVDSFIVEEDGTPVGYAQTWVEDDESGIDLALIPAVHGRGIGPLVIASLAQRLRAAGHRRVTGDPDAANVRSIRAFEKAGFVATGELRDDHVILELPLR